MHSAHDAMLCIANSSQIDSDDRPVSNAEAYVKSAAQMADLFIDLPEATENTLVIAQRCAFAPPRRKPILPSLAGDLEGEKRMLEEDARRGLAARLELYEFLSDEELKVYTDRLDYEVGIIKNMGFPGYFLIVADFIKWAKDQGIPVGPGRGSGAGSLVAWALTITDLDPIRLGLLFERFLNPERVSMPDFDIDFCETRRGEVIRYVQERYGKDKVAQIITFGKMKARAVLRDTGRILQMPYGQVDRLTKMVPNHPGDPWTLPRALNGMAEFKREYENDNQVKRLVDLAMKLEGYPRNSSTHAAGVVIGDRPLSQLVPLYRDPRSDMPVTQFDMKHVEDSGLVKFDFLGLKTLSVLRKAVDLLERRGITIDLDTLPWDDAGVFELLKRGDTVGVFQLEFGRYAPHADGGEADQVRGYHRARFALSAGSDGQHTQFRQAQGGGRGYRLSAPEAGRYPRGDLRHLRLPGAGDAGRADPGRLLAGRCRLAAPRDGQEKAGGNGPAARAFLRRLQGNFRHREG